MLLAGRIESLIWGLVCRILAVGEKLQVSNPRVPLYEPGPITRFSRAVVVAVPAIGVWVGLPVVLLRIVLSIRIEVNISSQIR